MLRFLLLFLATFGFANNLPRQGGFVNDFAGRLSAPDRDALESRLAEYERSSTNEVVVAIVSSLDGAGVDVYARRLFRSWGVGKREKNNGVLLLWAPMERKVRIQVGYGLEGALSDRAAAEVVRQITDRFRRDDWVGGLNTGIDGIIDRLEGTYEPPKHKSAVWVLGLPLAMAGGLIAIIIMLVRTMRLRTLTDSLPRDLAEAEQGIREAEGLRRAAGPALADLRRETPVEVWRDLEGVAESEGPKLSSLSSDFQQIQAMPRQDLGEMGKANRALRDWLRRFSTVRARLEAPGKRLAGYRQCRERAPGMLREVGAALAGRRSGWQWGQKAKMVDAAGSTFERAQSLAASAEVNWLMVYDLLVDAKDCLDCADNPGRYARRERYWEYSQGYSPGFVLLAAQTPNSGSDASAYSSGDSGGGSGGGACGDGGASGSY